MTDRDILCMSSHELLREDTFFSLLEVEEPEERTRLESLCELRAKEVDCYTEFRRVYKAFIAAQEKLTAESRQQKDRKNIGFEYGAGGKPKTTIDNFVLALERDRHFTGLKFNLLTNSPEQERDGKIQPWTDRDDAEARRYIEREYGFHSTPKCDDALRIVFDKNRYHPIRDLIDTFKWDGETRIYNFLHTWTKCEDTPYTREASRLLFAGGIHRLYNPGCKFDDMVVLVGTKQGEGKSTLVRWLALRDDFFTEVNEFEGTRGIESVEGAWICEVSELLAMTKAREQEAVKSYLTRLNDRYRMPYDRRVTDHPRQCIFVGTTNKEQFLTDKTGNRRFYPVRVKQSGYDLFDHEREIRDYIKQCWAEAKYLYDRGQIPPYADRQLTEEIRRQQSEATEDDYRVGMISAYLDKPYKTETCVLDLWQNALKESEYVKPSKKDSLEIGLIMQSLSGWEKQPAPKVFPDYGKQRWWKKVAVVEYSFNLDDLNDFVEID